MLLINIRKQSSMQRLGVRFLADGDGRGAVVASVDPFGPAWLAKFRPGDVLVSVLNNGAEHGTPSGFKAAEVLRPLKGIIQARVVRKRKSKTEAAALRIQAAAIGHAVRLGYGDARGAALMVQTHFRRWLACMRVCEALLAVRHIQDRARELIARQQQCRRSSRPSLLRRSIRAPASLELLEE